MKLSEIYFKQKDLLSTLLSKENKNKNSLSPLTLELLDSVFSGQNTLVFSQGPLNIAPLLAATYSLQNNQDIVIFLPRKNFEKNYRDQSRYFFSLLYATLNNPHNSKYFYEKILLCQGRLDNNSELTDLEIEAKPVHGDSEFRRRYHEILTEKCKNGTVTTSREIVYIPMERSIPLKILGNKSIIFEGFNKGLKFQPSFFIFESLNEMNFNFHMLFGIMRTLNELNYRFFIHTSWPYLRGLKGFLELLQDDALSKNTRIFHLGKRLGLELGKSLQSYDYSFDLSLEGKGWQRLYLPQNSSDKIRIYLPNTDSVNTDTINSVEESLFETDDIIHETNSLLDQKPMNHFIESILRFPPCIDSFVLPSEIKDFDSNEIKYLPLNEIIKKRLKNEPHFHRLNHTLNETLEKSRDLFYEINGLPTMGTVTKRTLLQMFLLEFIGATFSGNLDTSETKQLIIADLNSDLSSTKGMKMLWVYFVETIKNIIESLEYPSLDRTNQSVILKNSENNNIAIVLNDGKLEGVSKDAIIKSMQYEKLVFPLQVTTRKFEKGFEISIRLDVNANLLKIEMKNSHFDVHPNSWSGLDVCLIRLYENGNYETLNLKNISDSMTESFYAHKFSCEWELDRNGVKTSITKDYIFYYIGLQKIRLLSSESIKDSILLVPGPIPFTSVSGEKVFLSEGYDILLMPFRRIDFFSYSGRNLKYLNRQLKIYEELFSKQLSSVAQKDLGFSFKYTHFKAIELEKVDLPNEAISTTSEEFDEFMRDAICKEAVSSVEGDKTMMKIKEVLRKLPNRTREILDASDVIEDPESRAEDRVIKLGIKYDNGLTDKISFNAGTLLRKNLDGTFVLVPVDELVAGDEIIYIQKGKKRTSIDDYLLQIFTDDSILPLREILEPFSCLRLFTDALQSINHKVENHLDVFSKIYWLSNNQKLVLLKSLKSILNNNATLFKQQLIENDNIWKSFVSEDSCLSSSVKTEKNKMSYEKLYNIIKKAGMTLQFSTFKAYCNFDIRDDRHYFFRDSIDLLAIGRFIGNQNLIENYEMINENGKQIGVYLQIIGRSISRVARGEIDPFNRLDQIIEKEMQRCMVLSRSVE